VTLLGLSPARQAWLINAWSLQYARHALIPAPSRATWNSGGPRFISPPRISRIARRVKHLPRIYPEGYDVTNWANGKKQFEKFV